MATSFSLSKTLKPSSPSKTLRSLYTTTFPKITHLKFPPILKPQPLSLLFNTQFPKSQLSPIPRTIFTGIVQEMGQIRQLGASQIDGGFDMRISANKVLEDVNLGDSIAVNGTCLTVTHFDTQLSEFTVGLSPETLRLTSLIELEAGSVVNLERALKPTTRMGGHFVQGHVDGTGEIVGKEVEGDSLWIEVRTSPEILKYIVPKGFVAVDGTSLTVVKVWDEEGCFNFMLVEYTQQNVVIPRKEMLGNVGSKPTHNRAYIQQEIGQKVNLEVDILGKYVERLLSTGFVGAGRSS